MKIVPVREALSGRTQTVPKTKPISQVAYLVLVPSKMERSAAARIESMSVAVTSDRNLEGSETFARCSIRFRSSSRIG